MPLENFPSHLLFFSYKKQTVQFYILSILFYHTILKMSFSLKVSMMSIIETFRGNDIKQNLTYDKSENDSNQAESSNIVNLQT